MISCTLRDVLLFAWLALASVGLACNTAVGSATGSDGGSVDTSADASSEAAPDAASDAALLLPLAGFGVIGGDCDVLDTELTSTSPSLLTSSIEFSRMYTDADMSMLTEGGRTLIAAGNAGGSSLLSEVFAYELLWRCVLADLLKTETQIVYSTPGKITDLLARIDGDKIGVSVTRAVGFPFNDPYTVANARDLLERKLGDILISSANVAEKDRWNKQILAVLAFAPEHADSLRTALSQIDPAIVADTIVWILVTDGADDFIYCDGVCS